MASGVQDTDFVFKVIVVGDSGVGKTNLLLRYTQEEFDLNHASTLGVELSRVTQSIDGDQVMVDFWDTAGQERFKSLNKVYFRGAHGIILVYDITNQHSFRQLNSWYKIAKDNDCDPLKCVYMLVGNKNDLEDMRAVESSEGVQLARSINANFFETSALSSDNVENAMNDLIEEIHRQHKSNVRPDANDEKVKLAEGKPVKTGNGCWGKC